MESCNIATNAAFSPQTSILLIGQMNHKKVMCFRFLNTGYRIFKCHINLNAIGRLRFVYVKEPYWLTFRGNLLFITNPLTIEKIAELAREYMPSSASLLWNCKVRKEEYCPAPPQLIQSVKPQSASRNIVLKDRKSDASLLPSAAFFLILPWDKVIQHAWIQT